jgi:hypothetical protein
MPELSPPQMKLGDVLLLKDMGEVTHKIIAVGQAVMSHGWDRSSNITHAGLYGFGNTIAEASGSGHGLQSAAFNSKAAHYHFEVYRWASDEVAMRAAYWADILISQRGAVADFGGYSKSGAASSLVRSSSAGTGAAANNAAIQAAAQAALASGTITATDFGHDFYCSGFVVQCYVMAADAGAAPPINLDYRFVSPKRLEGELRKGGGWSHVGFIVAGHM